MSKKPSPSSERANEATIRIVVTFASGYRCRLMTTVSDAAASKFWRDVTYERLKAVKT